MRAIITADPDNGLDGLKVTDIPEPAAPKGDESKARDSCRTSNQSADSSPEAMAYSQSQQSVAPICAAAASHNG